MVFVSYHLENRLSYEHETGHLSPISPFITFSFLLKEATIEQVRHISCIVSFGDGLALTSALSPKIVSMGYFADDFHDIGADVPCQGKTTICRIPNETKFKLSM